MKKIFLFIVVTITLITTSFANNPRIIANNPIESPLFGTVTLTAGTLVILETTESLRSDNATVGQIIQFRVKTNVVAEGKVVVLTGAIGIGRVKAIKKTTYNDPEEITVEVTSVRAVDGQQIALSGNEQTYKGKFSGEGTMIYSGSTITANVMNTTPITVN